MAYAGALLQAKKLISPAPKSTRLQMTVVLILFQDLSIGIATWKHLTTPRSRGEHLGRTIYKCFHWPPPPLLIAVAAVYTKVLILLLLPRMMLRFGI